MEYIEIMSTIEIFERILLLVNKLSLNKDLPFEVSNSIEREICTVEYNKEVYEFFYNYKDNKLRISIVEVDGGIPSFFGEDLNTVKFRNRLIGMHRFLSKWSS